MHPLIIFLSRRKKRGGQNEVVFSGGETTRVFSRRARPNQALPDISPLRQYLLRNRDFCSDVCILGDLGIIFLCFRIVPRTSLIQKMEWVESFTIPTTREQQIHFIMSLIVSYEIFPSIISIKFVFRNYDENPVPDTYSLLYLEIAILPRRSNALTNFQIKKKTASLPRHLDKSYFLRYTGDFLIKGMSLREKFCRIKI